jgi:hypothetical protein
MVAKSPQNSTLTLFIDVLPVPSTAAFKKVLKSSFEGDDKIKLSSKLVVEDTILPPGKTECIERTEI